MPSTLLWRCNSNAPRDVELVEPRTPETRARLTATLSALGLGRAFGPDADFRPMSPTSPTLDTVVQKTYLRVDEVGTEPRPSPAG